MKNRQSISHYTGREQHALLRLKNQIVTVLNPLIIYLIGSRSNQELHRNCFTNPRNNNQWIFSCDLLVVTSDNAGLPEPTIDLFKNQNTEFENIRIVTHPFSFVVKQLQKHSLFFSWIQQRAIVLYEKDNAHLQLPQHVQNMKQYEKQVHLYFLENPNYENYDTVKLMPLPLATDQQEPKIKADKQSILSATLQQKMAMCLQEHGANNMKLRMQEAMTEYIIAAAKKGISNNFYEILWDFEALMLFFDLAEKEYSAKGATTPL